MVSINSQATIIACRLSEHWASRLSTVYGVFFFPKGGTFYRLPCLNIFVVIVSKSVAPFPEVIEEFPFIAGTSVGSQNLTSTAFQLLWLWIIESAIRIAGPRNATIRKETTVNLGIISSISLHLPKEDLIWITSVPSWIPQWNIHVKGAILAFLEVWDESSRLKNKSVTRFHITDNGLTIHALFIGAHTPSHDTVREKDLTTSNSTQDGVIERC